MQTWETFDLVIKILFVMYEYNGNMSANLSEKKYRRNLGQQSFKVTELRNI